MTRSYTLKRRAEQQADTRRRIVEAAVGLHGTIGPAQTSLSMIAERAGVQRHTLYAHFPDERSLFVACSGLVEERDPLPQAAPWRDIADRSARIRTGLSAVSLVAAVLRDGEHHALTRETSERRFGPPMAQWREVLAAGLSNKQYALLALALSFHTWRTLAGEAGLETAAAVEAMLEAIEQAQ